MKILVAQSIQVLNDVARKVAGYKNVVEEECFSLLNKDKDGLKALLLYRGIKKLRNIKGFSSGKSQVEQELYADTGGFGRGKINSAISLRVRTKKAAIIANAWNKGANIQPKNVFFLAEPVSEGQRLPIKSIERKYPKKAYSTWFYQNANVKGSNHPNIEQDVRGLMVIRERKNLVSTKDRLGKPKKVGKVVAKFILMKSQTIKPTHWAFHALKEFRRYDVTAFAKDKIGKELKRVKLI